jgi:acyl-CoA thioesterase-1
MKLHPFFAALLFLPLLAFAQAVPKKVASVTDEPGLPRVLLIGDSISIDYTVPVRELLKGVANVHRIPENGGSTRDGLAKLDGWLGAQSWDVIHFNWGLHDLARRQGGKLDIVGPQTAPVELYEKNLRELVARLERTGAKLIFATTTPVPKGAPGRFAGNEVAYNEAARRVMAEAHVAVNDLHAAVREQLPTVQNAKDVHFKKEGSRLLAEKVAEAIRAQLAAK